MGIQKFLATFFGDIWYSKKCFGIGHYIYGLPESKLHGVDYRELSKIIKPGDILLTRSQNYKFSNKGIPEKYTYLKHLAIYIGSVDGKINGDFINVVKKDGKQFPKCIIHAVSEGVVCQDLFDVFRHFDYIVVVRPWKSSFEQSLICEMAFKLLGREYDFEFKSGNKNYYCTELGIQCIQTAAIKVPQMTKINAHIIGLFLPLERFKHKVTVADSFLKCFPTIFKSDSYRREKDE